MFSHNKLEFIINDVVFILYSLALPLRHLSFLALYIANQLTSSLVCHSLPLMTVWINDMIFSSYV